MTDYRAPLRDIDYALFEVLDYDKHYTSLGLGEDMSSDTVKAITEEAAKFCENVIAPLNAVGDEQGCTLKDGVVTTPQGFKEAYSQFVEAGWPSMVHSAEHGGQGLPASIGFVLSELTGTANWSWAMYPGLSDGRHRKFKLIVAKHRDFDLPSGDGFLDDYPLVVGQRFGHGLDQFLFRAGLAHPN